MYSEEHVCYEFEMFLWVVQVMTSGDRPVVVKASDPSRFKNAIIEVFVVHLRNLIDFFYSNNPQSTDIVASDFCHEGTWRREMSKSLELARTRANKELAHMTSARIRGASSEKAWDFAGLYGELKSAVDSFLDIASPSRFPFKLAATLRANYNWSHNQRA
jgi:hypothetical protein